MIILKRSFIPALAGVGIALILVAALALLGIASDTLGGMAGAFVGHLAEDLFGVAGAIVLLVAIACLGLVIATDIVALMNRPYEAGVAAGTALGNVEVKLPTLGKKGEEDAEEEPAPEAEAAANPVPEHEPTIKNFNERPTGAKAAAIPNFDAEYDPPPLSLLGEDKGKAAGGDIKANANIIKRTFRTSASTSRWTRYR